MGLLACPIMGEKGINRFLPLLFALAVVLAVFAYYKVAHGAEAPDFPYQQTLVTDVGFLTGTGTKSMYIPPTSASYYIYRAKTQFDMGGPYYCGNNVVYFTTTDTGWVYLPCDGRSFRIGKTFSGKMYYYCLEDLRILLRQLLLLLLLLYLRLLLLR